MKKSILFLTLVFVFSSCNETKKVVEVESNEILSGKYEIKSTQGVPANKLFFEIDASENKISGKTNCNTYGGNFSVTNNEINIGPLMVTKMYCEEHVMKEEHSIFKAFGDAKTFVYDNNMFTLSSEEGVVLQAYRLVKE